MKRFLTQGFLLSTLLLVVPIFVSADIVPCDGPDCDTCDFVQLGGNLMSFFVTFSVMFAGLLFAWGGFNMVTSGGDMGKVGKGKTIMTDSIIGIIIILSAWLVMDTALKLFVNSNDEGSQVYGMWNEIQCYESSTLNATQSQGGLSPLPLQATFSESQMEERLRVSEKYKEDLCMYARMHGIEDQCDTLHALVAAETGGISSVTSDKGAIGLMQVMPDTAREILVGKLGSSPSDASIRTYLNTPSQNIEVGVKYYAKLYNQYGGDVTKTLAAYNGGTVANESSEHCGGVAKWQCEWDNIEHTQPNEGYKETRNYVANITAMTEMLKND